jgi:hypothetical protein
MTAVEEAQQFGVRPLIMRERELKRQEKYDSLYPNTALKKFFLREEG